MASIAELLAAAKTSLGDSDSPALDAELMLAACLEQSRSYLYTWPERSVATTAERRFEGMLARRRCGEPIAYILGCREFWSLPLAVTPDTLIPRPDTETLVRQALQVLDSCAVPPRVLDLGTGSGALALAIASERPEADVLGIDRIPGAVMVARQNARELGIGNARFVCADWFAALGAARFNLIVSNPPYVAAGDPLLDQGDVRFEPRAALAAGADGLDDLRHIIALAPQYLSADGSLWVEHGCDQGAAVRDLFAARPYYEKSITLTDLSGHDRVTGARRRDE